MYPPIVRIKKELSLEIPSLGGLHVSFPVGGTGMVGVEHASQYEKQYAMNNGVICFIDRGRAYLLKGYGLESKLVELGFKKGSFPVPLSNGETLLGPMTAERWRNLPTSSGF